MTQQIKPAYATYEQAKKLEEKGFDCNSDYNQWILAKDKGDDSKRFICHSDELENYTYINEEEQFNVYHCLAIPEQWQIVEWLRINHGIWVSIRVSNNKFNLLVTNLSGDILFNDSAFNTPQEAYSAAFDYIKDNDLI